MSSNKETLNDIINKFQDLEVLILEAEGEISEELERKLLDNDDNLSAKLDGYEKFSRYLKGQVEYLKSAEEQYSKRRKTIDNSIKRIKERMLNAMLVVGKENLKTIEHNYSVGSSEKWSLDLDSLNESIKVDLLNQGLAENIFKANLMEIKNKYKKENVPDWVHVDKSNYLRVK